eukprot:TRINITY_DN4592_c0_g2_i2.p1 TRINITY_DN4592_c0_g2~~TRINITY_DN4592_c0_g2_i2.p1  ORF type:complete len:534 (+),score=110.15 TRINITY_DN4592_c0_g2_i2:137-1738(+)
MNILEVDSSSALSGKEPHFGFGSPQKDSKCEVYGNASAENTSGVEDDQKLHVAIFTTASLPWLTGTAVNPLFRAAYLAKIGEWKVTLVIPWLTKSNQALVYPNNMIFESPPEQEKYILQWLEERIGYKPSLILTFYPAKFAQDKRSIFAIGDITNCITEKDANVAILEEPEHLTWFHHGKRWTKKFKHVIGIIHTNYLEYVKRESYGVMKAFLLKYVNTWVTTIHCHTVIRLSGATQNFPNSIVCNVNGVNPKFLEIGQNIAVERKDTSNYFSKGAYYIGKMLWGKGYRELLDLLSMHQNELKGFQIDVYGNGEDSDAIKEEARKLKLQINFNPAIEHSHEQIYRYRVLINPSLSDVLCTTTAEALAMGKIVVCADHPSNEFFKSFPNCITFIDYEEFIVKVRLAMSMEPIPLNNDQQHTLSWEAATERLIECSKLGSMMKEDTEVSHKKRLFPLLNSFNKLKEHVENGFAKAHFIASGNESVRVAAGAVPSTLYPDEDQCIDLGLDSHSVKQPVYNWISSCLKCSRKQPKEE